MTQVRPLYLAAVPPDYQWRTLDFGPPQPVTKPYDWLHPQSTVYVCSYCGEAWGMVAYPAGHNFRPQAKLCARHGNGSFLHWATTPSDIAQLPDGVVQYEFNLAMEREQWNHSNV